MSRQIAGSTPAYYHSDHLGSVRALTDQSGAVVATYAYDAYGQPAGGTASAPNPFRYAGQYRDSESGLYYLRARYYDPYGQPADSPAPAPARRQGRAGCAMLGARRDPGFAGARRGHSSA